MPRSKGGKDDKSNVICACKQCNTLKGHTPWKTWYSAQDFFTIERLNDIINWTTPDESSNYVVYRPRKRILDSKYE